MDRDKPLSDSLSPPPEYLPELDIPEDTQASAVEEDDNDISSDTSGSLPGSPRPEEDADAVTVCRWDNCNQNLKSLDALVRHVHDCIYSSSLLSSLLLYIIIVSLIITVMARPHWHSQTTIYV
jgi:hypothetical protein